MCSQFGMIHQGCRCVYDEEPVERCERSGTAGHVVDRQLFELGQKCPVHEDGQPWKVQFLLDEAERQGYCDFKAESRKARAEEAA